MSAIREVVAALCPRPHADLLASFDHAGKVFAQYGLKTTRRQAHFLAQVLHESGRLARCEENLNYTTPASICAVWPSRFKDRLAALPYVRNPEALANKVYGGRMGNTEPGDGWKYRGRGIIQLTGRENYASYGKLLGIPLEDKPELACSPDYTLHIACTYWDQRKLNALADANNIVGITKRINGGVNGLEDRKALYKTLVVKLGGSL